MSVAENVLSELRLHKQARRPNIGVTHPRVLLVGPALGRGGAENRFRLVAEHLFNGTADVAVFEGPVDGILGGRQRVLSLNWRGEWSYPAMISRLRRHVRRLRPDVIMGFGFYPNFVAWAAIAGMRTRPSLVLSEINSPWREYLEVRGSVRGRLIHELRKFLYPRASLYAANSEDGIADAVEYYGVNPAHVRRIPNLVDPKRLRQLAGIDAGTDDKMDNVASICIVGRLFHRKRVDTLLRAGARLSREREWRIDVVGDGPDRRKLEDLAQELGIRARVRFHGWLENPYPVIARAAVSVLCSEFEGFPNVVLEAMALGVPVITSLNTWDARKMVEQGAALGFPVGNDVALSEQLEILLKQHALRSRLIEKANEYIRFHILESGIREYETLFDVAISLHRVGSV